MADPQVQVIIDFAIEKEQEAVDFYTDLAQSVKNAQVSEELRKFAAIEMGHKEKLEELDLASWTAEKPDTVVDLKIADYIVEQQPSPDMDYQDIIAIAMKRELAAQRLYTDLARLAAGSATEEVFRQLASEEAQHKNYFEKIWDDQILAEN